MSEPAQAPPVWKVGDRAKWAAAPGVPLYAAVEITEAPDGEGLCWARTDTGMTVHVAVSNLSAIKIPRRHVVVHEAKSSPGGPCYWTEWPAAIDLCTGRTHEFEVDVWA